MPTKYRKITGYKPLDFDRDLERIAQLVNDSRDAILKLFSDIGFPIDYDDSDRLFDDLKEILTKFALAANAMPLRTPNMLMATVKVIGNNPRDFLQDSEKFDPEAAALVIGACGGRSSINKRLLLEYESGIGSGPPPEEIAKAAEQVLAELSKKTLCSQYEVARFKLRRVSWLIGLRKSIKRAEA